MALFLYRFIFFCLTPILLLLLIIRSKSQKAYRQRLAERFGLLSSQFKTTDVVVHAASVGEVLAIRPFVEQLLQQNLTITFTTFTPTGSEQVKKLFADRVQHCYLPLDIWPSTLLFLNRIKPKAIVVMETEIWPNLIAQCTNKDIKLLLINGRLSESSMKSYSKIRPLIADALVKFNKILCQSQQNRDNFAQLGATSDQLEVSGNVKFDLKASEAHDKKAQQIKELIPENKRLWLIASTHAGDEAIALESFKHLTQHHDNVLLVIVPRHPERFDQVVALAESYKFNCQRRSTNQPTNPDTQVWILDTLGELMSVFQLADIVTMGGSFSTIGGHNPLEPALYKKPVIVGYDMRNFAEVEQQLLEVDGLIKLEQQDIEHQLSRTVTQLLELPGNARKLGDNAYQVVINNQGATARSVQTLIQLIQDNDPPKAA